MKNKPSLILVHTHIGFGAPEKQDTFEAHGNPLGEEELRAAKKNLGWPSMDKFYLPEDSVNFFRQAIGKGAKAEQDWQSKFDAYKKAFPKEAAELDQMIAGKLPEDWRTDLPKWKPEDKPLATRAAGGQVLNAIGETHPQYHRRFRRSEPVYQHGAQRGRRFSAARYQGWRTGRSWRRYGAMRAVTSRSAFVSTRWAPR